MSIKLSTRLEMKWYNKNNEDKDWKNDESDDNEAYMHKLMDNRMAMKLQDGIV